MPMYANAMNNNQQAVVETRAKLKDFEATLEPERLREAYMALENVFLPQEPVESRGQLRTQTLALWLYLVRSLDQHTNPKFDPDDVPTLSVQPPPSGDGLQFPPGADPADIKDPKARAEYEKAIAANNAKAANYRLQTGLRRLNPRITPRAQEFIQTFYTSSPQDREELQTSIEKFVSHPKRKAELLKFVKPAP